jgi:hypothetical protein
VWRCILDLARGWWVTEECIDPYDPPYPCHHTRVRFMVSKKKIPHEERIISLRINGVLLETECLRSSTACQILTPHCCMQWGENESTGTLSAPKQASVLPLSLQVH